MAQGNQGGWQESLRTAGPFIGLGLQIALSIAFFVGGGLFVDTRLGTMPGFTLAGAAVGMVAVFFLLRRLIREMGDDLDRQRARRDEGDSASAE